jgi:hypothetical protein
MHVRMIPYNSIKCYYGYYVDSNCLHRTGCVPDRQFRSYTFKLLCFGVSAAAPVHIGTAPCDQDTMCKRHRSGVAFFRPVAPRNPDLQFQVNHHRNFLRHKCRKGMRRWSGQQRDWLDPGGPLSALYPQEPAGDPGFPTLLMTRS